MRAGRRLLVGLLVVIGLALIAVGIVYFVVKAGSLPSSSLGTWWARPGVGPSTGSSRSSLGRRCW